MVIYSRKRIKMKPMRTRTRLLLLLGMLTVTGCESLSHPGATQRLMRLNSYASSQSKAADTFFDARYYVDHKTPQQRIDEQFDKIDDHAE